MPMQMGRFIAEAGKIDFIGLQDVAYRAFHSEYHRHEAFTKMRFKIAHFLDMPVKDYTAKTWIIGIFQPYDAA